MKRVFLALTITLLFLAAPAGIAFSNMQSNAWTKYEGNPILYYGAPGSWDDFNVYAVHVMYYDNDTTEPSDDEYRMWYSGTSFTRNSKDIGLARSKDGITWSRYVGNPVIRNGDFGYWDYERINAPPCCTTKRKASGKCGTPAMPAILPASASDMPLQQMVSFGKSTTAKATDRGLYLRPLAMLMISMGTVSSRQRFSRSTENITCGMQGSAVRFQAIRSAMLTRQMASTGSDMSSQAPSFLSRCFLSAVLAHGMKGRWPLLP